MDLQKLMMLLRNPRFMQMLQRARQQTPQRQMPTNPYQGPGTPGQFGPTWPGQQPMGPAMGGRMPGAPTGPGPQTLPWDPTAGMTPQMGMGQSQMGGMPPPAQGIPQGGPRMPPPPPPMPPFQPSPMQPQRASAMMDPTALAGKMSRY